MNLPPTLLPLLMLLALPQTALAAGAQGNCSKIPGVKMTSLASMAIKTPVDVLSQGGPFSRLELGTGKSQRLSDHGAFKTSVVVPSADGRWIVYGGVLKREDRTQFWAHDRHAGSDRLILDTPAWGMRVPHFSPDSKHLALAASHGTDIGVVATPFMLMMSTADWNPVRIDVPVEGAAGSAFTASRWADDSAALMIMVSAFGREERHYYTYRVADRQLEQAAPPDPDAYDRKVVREGQVFERFTMRTIVESMSARSPDGKWHAYPGELNSSGTYPLHLRGADGIVKTFAKGSFGPCVGQSLAVSGWLDNRHVVYGGSTGKFFVFDVSTGLTARLFEAPASRSSFTW